MAAKTFFLFFFYLFIYFFFWYCATKLIYAYKQENDGSIVIFLCQKKRIQYLDNLKKITVKKAQA